MARANEPTFAAAAANARVAALDHSIARAALLPNATFHNQYLYTQPNGSTVTLPDGEPSLCRSLSPTMRFTNIPARLSSTRRWDCHKRSRSRGLLLWLPWLRRSWKLPAVDWSLP